MFDNRLLCFFFLSKRIKKKLENEKRKHYQIDSFELHEAPHWSQQGCLQKCKKREEAKQRRPSSKQGKLSWKPFVVVENSNCEDTNVWWRIYN